MANPDVTLSTLSSPERNLVRLMQAVGRGRLRHLTVRDGQPSFEAPLTAVRSLKLRKGQPPEPVAPASEDFALRREVTALLAQIRGMKFGMIERLEVLDGLPTTVEIAEPLAPPATSTPTSRP